MGTFFLKGNKQMVAGLPVNKYLPRSEYTPTDLSSYVPYTGATGDVDLGGNNLDAQTITATAEVFTAPAAPTSGTAVRELGHGSGYGSTGQAHAWRIYAYKDTPSGKIFSTEYLELSYTDPADFAGGYAVLVDWTASPGADGYRILKDDDTRSFDASVDVTTNSLIDEDVGGELYNSLIFATTPNTGKGTALIADGVSEFKKYIQLTSDTLKANNEIEAGNLEFEDDDLYFTITTGPARKVIPLINSALTSGRIAFTTTNGRLTDVQTLLFDGSKMGIGGTASPSHHIDINYTTSNAINGLAVRGGNNSASVVPLTHTKKSRNTVASPTTTVNGDGTGTWLSWGHDGTNYIASGGIGFRNNGTVATGSVPTDLIFSAGSADAQMLQNEKARISSDGTFHIANILSLGSEKITNGTFTGTTGWTGFGAGGWSNLSGIFGRHGSNGTGTLSQARASMVTGHDIGKVYLLAFSTSSYSTAPFTVSIGGWTSGDIASNGTYEFIVVPTSTADLTFTPQNTNRVTIDNVSLKEITGGALNVARNINAASYSVGGVAGFTGTGSYTNFTIVGGIITNAT